jgi:hypothetical protein
MNDKNGFRARGKRWLRRGQLIVGTIAIIVVAMLVVPAGTLAGTRPSGGSRCGVDLAKSKRVTVMHCDGQIGVAVGGTVQQCNTTLASTSQQNVQTAAATGSGRVTQDASNQATISQKTHEVAVAIFGNVQQTATNVANVALRTRSGGDSRAAAA